jgi:hypothetical protein
MHTSHFSTHFSLHFRHFGSLMYNGVLIRKQIRSSNREAGAPSNRQTRNQSVVWQMHTLSAVCFSSSSSDAAPEGIPRGPPTRPGPVAPYAPDRGSNSPLDKPWSWCAVALFSAPQCFPRRAMVAPEVPPGLSGHSSVTSGAAELRLVCDGNLEGHTGEPVACSSCKTVARCMS